MAKATPELIAGLRRTAHKLEQGAKYQWGHMGCCNCGNLAQEMTGLSKAEIHQYAMRKHGDWTEQAMDYCATSGMPMDLLISQLLDAGLSIEDLRHLEKLSDTEVLRKMPTDKRYPKQNQRDDVVAYMRTWAELLEEKYLATATLPRFEQANALEMVE
jgi:hypothetical protein